LHESSPSEGNDKASLKQDRGPRAIFTLAFQEK
jgi:hypothetical protein